MSTVIEQYLHGSERFRLAIGRHDIWAYTCAGAGAGAEPKVDIAGAEPPKAKVVVDVAGACSHPT